jgi:para-aminobenzoate synthetase component 1
MRPINQHTIARMNKLGAAGQPFAFLIDFAFGKPLIFLEGEPTQLFWKTPLASNFNSLEMVKPEVEWAIDPVSFVQYKAAYDLVQQHIHSGDTYLLNLTMPTKVKTNLTLEQIFYLSDAPYKIWLKDHFVCFSPEVFVRISNGQISSFPMKGTIDAKIPDAAKLLCKDEKEVAEHHTIVDLIRNDLSRFAHEVEVKRLMYLDLIHTNQGDLWQMSSEITGKLPDDYYESIGTILSALLPAGSICGAPKAKTLEIINRAEQYDRGYYTGVFGVFDGKNLDSCVLIRYLEKEIDQLIFKSGGGITFLSDCKTEYEELIRKVYVPIA